MADDRIDTRDLQDELDTEDDERRFAIRELFEELRGYAGDDPEDGVFLIREDTFEEYAEELADDIGAIDRQASWPLCHIDWKAAAEHLKQDYTEVEFEGATYLYR
jgi:hypothetical protein